MEPAAVIVSDQQQLIADETITLPQVNVQLLPEKSPVALHRLELLGIPGPRLGKL
jgi:hypothetical protein